MDADALASDRVIQAGEALAAAFRPQAGTFFFLRHGRTEANRKGIIQGQQDVPLDDTGRAQAAQAGAALRAALRESGAVPPRIVSSDLSRAAETARIVADALGLEVAGYDAGLRERGFGPVEGTAGRNLHWDGDPEGAEPVARFVARCRDALLRHLDAGPQPLLLVAHGGVLRATAALLRLGLTDPARVNAVPLRFLRGGEAWRMEFVVPQPATGAATQEVPR